MVQTSEKIYTVEEYFELEKTSEIRHEFVYGKLIPMSGESKIANKITGNCYRFLCDFLNDNLFEVYNHEVRLMIESGKLYRYPDLVVVPVADDVDTHATTQPILIIEVLSESTAAIDRGEKLRQYSNLPSLQYYLLISQNESVVEMYSRVEERWMLDFFTSLDETIELPILKVSLPMATVFQKVKFK
ncbi:MAG: Uma2 family endonuclease [Saprospiraceae bacterium]|nr:Uma2 family endonuclease [Saprospiraceae bacterium]